jgi:N-glycosylase/DNA lyase
LASLKSNTSVSKIEELHKLHNLIGSDVSNRIKSFKNIWNSGLNEDLFVELVFCLLTPQAKALEAGKAISVLIETGELYNANAEEISLRLNRVRFKNNKAKNLVAARKQFLSPDGDNIQKIISNSGDIFLSRKWFAENVLGMGYKEASHFLRNVGFVEELAILDRHILKNMKLYGVIDELPKSLTPSLYLDLEKRLKNFSLNISIPMGHLDFVFWFKETNTIYK